MTDSTYGYPDQSTPVVTGDPAYNTDPAYNPGPAYNSHAGYGANPTYYSSDPGDDSPSVKDKAADTAEAGKQAAADVAQNAAGQAKDVVQETKKQARDLVGEARGQLAEQAGVQHRNLVTNLRSLADELASMADRSENAGTATDLVSQAGDRAHGVADWLDQREPGALLGEVKTFAQQRPGAFLLGALAAGVVAGRLTRGAVAAHSDDGGAPNDSADEASGAPRHQALEYPVDNGRVAP